MVTVDAPDIYDILEKEGYCCDKLSYRDWEDLNQEWEYECEDFLKEQIEKHKAMILLEWSSRCNVSKK